MKIKGKAADNPKIIYIYPLMLLYFGLSNRGHRVIIKHTVQEIVIRAKKQFLTKKLLEQANE